MKTYLFSFLLVTISFANVWGQLYSMRNYDMQNGLSHSTVYRIFQDKKGFIWFCTDYGLSLFDGKRFHNYYSIDGLPGNCVLSVSENEKEEKLVSIFHGGLAIVSDTSVRKYTVEHGQMPSNISYAFEIGERIWLVGLDDGWNLFGIKKGTIKKYVILDDSFRTVNINKGTQYKGMLFLTSNKGIYCLEDSIVRPYLKNLFNEPVIDIKFGVNGDEWIGLKNRVAQVKNGKIINTYWLKGKQTLSSLLLDSHNNVWVALTDYGMLMIGDNKAEDITNRLGIHNTIVNDLFEDVEGNVWIATYNAGVYMINSLAVENYPVEENKINIYTKALAPIDNNTIIIGTIGKVGLWKNGIITPIDFKLLAADQFIYFGKFLDNKIYIGTPYGLLTKSMKYPFTEALIPLENGAGVGSISFCKDKDGNIWLGGYTTLLKLNGTMFKVVPISDTIKKRYKAIVQDHIGNIWFGLDSGILIYDGKTYARKYIPADGIGTNNINSILEDSHSRIWLATENGLAFYENGAFHIITTKDGLTHNKCNALAEDKKGRLWVGTVNGLSIIDLNTLIVQNYFNSIYPKEVLSLYCNDSDKLFVGTPNGLSVIQTEQVEINNAPPPVYITSLKTDKTLPYNNNGVSLPYNKNKLTIDFIGLSYRYADMIEYRYKIQKIDDNWHYTKNNSVELSTLPPGDFNFVLNARQNNGKWSADLVLPIHVSTPFWKEWWFYSVSALFILGLFFAIIRWQIIKSEFKKREQLFLFNKIIYLKQQALSALINPHFIFNSMNSIQHYLNKHDNDMANSYLADFASLVRMTMENAQEAFITLGKEIDRIELYLSLEKLRFGEDLEYEISIDPALNVNEINIPNMILQPYVENAILHGIMPNNESGSIIVRFLKNSENELKILVQDDGIGISNSKKRQSDNIHKPFGMKLTEERLNLLNTLLGQYYHVSIREVIAGDKNICGTIVEIILPFSPKSEELKRIEAELNS